MPAIKKPNLHFDATTYTGTGSALSVTNGGFQPDWVWMKSRTSGGSPYTNHVVIDSVRGAGTYGYKNLNPNLTDGDYDPSSGNAAVTALNSNGFTLGGNANVNTNTMTAVAWQWKASNAAAVTNTTGTISSQVSANPTAGFSIVAWTGNGVNSATVGHGLGAVPAMIICKERSGTDYWHVKHKSTATNTNLFLNQSLASTSAASVGDGVLADLTSNTTFGFATAGSPGNVVAVNENGVTNIAYCWAEIPGYSSFGTYTGTGSADGPFVYLGFRPAFLMIKRTNSGDSWFMYDNKREPFNANDSYINANTDSAEDTNNNTIPIDFVSNGFKIRGTSTGINGSGSTYIYMAFAEAPFKFSNGR
jgi:hypothetical protein